MDVQNNYQEKGGGASNTLSVLFGGFVGRHISLVLYFGELFSVRVWERWVLDVGPESWLPVSHWIANLTT